MTFNRSLLALVLAALATGLVAQTKPSGHGQPAAPSARKPCPRAVPKPVFGSGLPGVSSQTFAKPAKTLIGAREAVETAVLASGDSVTVNHWGCRFFILTFDVASKERLSLKAGPVEAYLEAAKVLRQLDALKAKTGFNLEKAAKALEQAAKNPKVALVVPVSLGGKDTVAVKAAGTGEDKTKGHVQFELMRGPL
jgi:hypothetical protein